MSQCIFADMFIYSIGAPAYILNVPLLNSAGNGEGCLSCRSFVKSSLLTLNSRTHPTRRFIVRVIVRLKQFNASRSRSIPRTWLRADSASADGNEGRKVSGWSLSILVRPYLYHPSLQSANPAILICVHATIPNYYTLNPLVGCPCRPLHGHLIPR